MHKISVTEWRRLPHRHESVVKTLVKSTAMALGMSSLLWGAGAAFAEDVPDLVTIKHVAWAGSGCLPGIVPLGDSSRTAFTLVFSGRIAVGPGIPSNEDRKNCNLILRLSFPHGWSFTIFDVVYRGFASLDRGVTGTLRSAYSFEGGFPSAALQATLIGPFEDNFEIRDTLGLDELVWSPCGVERALKINTEVRVNNRANRKGSGLMIGTFSGEWSSTYGIMWRRC